MPRTENKNARVTKAATKVTPLYASAIGPALGLLELNSIARGMVVADVMAKKAAIKLAHAEAVTPGKFIIVVVGGEEEVSQALQAGLASAGDTLIDRLNIPKIDPQVLAALNQEFIPAPLAALGIVETYSVAAAIEAADRAVKNAQVQLIKMQLARGLGGRGYFLLTGSLHQIEAGVLAARQVIHQGMLLTTEIIAQPDPMLFQALNLV